MTYQLFLLQQVELIRRLLLILPYCDTDEESYRILTEIRRLRISVSNIEEMTKTERQKEVKFRVMTIESRLEVYAIF